MSNKKKSISRVLMWQMASQIILTSITLITAPIFTRLLSKTEYGIFANFNSWVAIVGIILGLQTSGSIANAKSDFSDKVYMEYTSSILILSMIGFLIIFALSFPFKTVFSVCFTVDESIVSLVIAASFFTYVSSFYSQKLTIDLMVEKNTIISVLNSLLTFFLSLVLVLNMQTNRYLGRIYGMLITLIGISLYASYDILINGKCIYKKEYWKYCLSLTLPLIFHSLAGMILSLSDKVMLTKMNGEESTAVYSVAYSMGNVVQLIWVAFNSTWVPFYYQYKKEDNVIDINCKLKNYTILFTIIVVGFLLCVPEVFRLFMPSSYWIGVSIIPLIVLGYYFNFMYSIYGNYEFYHKKTNMISIGTVFCALLNLILNFILIPIYNEFGAAIATVIAYALLYIFHYTLSKKVFGFKCEINNNYLLIGMIIVLLFSIMYYFTLKMYVARWLLAIVLGIYLLNRVIKQRALL